MRELLRRLEVAAFETGCRFELVLVDDASTDGTARLLADASASNPSLRVVTLPVNAGQFRATRAGLAAARGAMVAVLDGDLQDPPEMLPALVEKLKAHPEIEVVFAVKSRRDDPPWMKAGQAVFHGLQNRLARTPFPPGAGSYCLMRREIAQRVGGLAVNEANLAAVLTAMEVRGASVTYEKQSRQHGTSRVGPVRLAREAIESLALTGALERLGYLAAFTLITSVLLVALTAEVDASRAVVVSAVAFAIVVAGLGRWHGRRARRRMSGAFSGKRRPVTDLR